MLGELTAALPLIQATFDLVSEKLGYDIWNMVQHGPVEALNQTEHTQVAMLTADVALFRVLQVHVGVTPMMMAGHSLGEYAALVCSGAIELSDAAVLVQRRGQLMQQSVPLGKGSMAAIVGLSDADIDTICKEASSTEYLVTPANYNAIGQVVIAGHTQAVEKAIELAQSLNARMAKLIPVSVPCHCPLLEQAAEQFAEVLAAAPFKIPDVPVISNVDLSVYVSPDHMRKLLKEQLYSPVRWVETIQYMRANGVEMVVECGPGRVLCGLTKRIDTTLSTKQVYELL
jgi:[acyl-carrier-protein] S-malonyltransferase